MKNGIQKPKKINLKNFFREYSIVIVSGIILALLLALLISERGGYARFAGGFLVSSLLIVVFYRDILRYKPNYMEKYNMLALLAIMIFSTIFFAKITNYVLVTLSKGFNLSLETTIYGLPIPAGAMLVTLLFDFHTAIVFSFIVSLLSGLWLNDAVYPVFAFVGSLVAAFSVIRCKKRSAIIKGGLYVALANSLTALMLLLFSDRLSPFNLTSSIIFTFFSGFTAMTVVSLLLPLLEYSFKITTDISLLELLDLNQPLMKSLMVSAPGTYHHSVIVGNLVEAAAEEIGINPLLGRVSAYYHDIGKIKMPDYFIENQSTPVSKHDKITPHMSSMIITSHVKEGVELARQYKLPEVIIDIIQQHHGTCLITYFFQKAKEHPELYEPLEEAYKYAGPKPQTRVAAVVMLADAVEASSRVLTEPTPARIAALVDKIFNHILLEGQLDECELTLKDITKIKKSFTYILTGIFHRRIDYPGFNFSSRAEVSGEPDPYNEGLYKEPAKSNKSKQAAN